MRCRRWRKRKAKPQRSSLCWCQRTRPPLLGRRPAGQGWPAEFSALTHKLWARRPHGVRALSLHQILSHHPIPFQIQQASFSDKGQTSLCVSGFQCLARGCFPAPSQATGLCPLLKTCHASSYKPPSLHPTQESLPFAPLQLQLKLWIPGDAVMFISTALGRPGVSSRVMHTCHQPSTKDVWSRKEIQSPDTFCESRQMALTAAGFAPLCLEDLISVFNEKLFHDCFSFWESPSG